MSIDSVKQDSLSLPSVEILAKQLMINEKPDVLLEQSSIALINGFSLTEVLNEEANIYMRNYGPGTAATISMRGSGPSQTQLSWNDMPIASPTLGLSDFSLVHANVFDGIQVFKGNQSAEYGSGAIGGRINLMSYNSIDDPEDFTLSFTNGSFGTFGSSLRLNRQIKNIKTHTAVSYIQSDNDFEIKLTPGNSMQQENADFYSLNFLQGINYSINPNSNIDFQLWALINDRSIPPTTTQTISRSAQQDQSVKALLAYRYGKESWGTEIKLGYTLEDQAYQDSLIGLFTENEFDQLFVQAEVYQTLDIIKYSVKSQYLQHKALTGNYTSKIDQTRWSNVLGVEWESTYFQAELNSRFMTVNGHWKSPVNQMTVSSKWSKNIQLEYNLGQLFRLPTLNDLYWRPGGNELLKEETGYESSLALSFSKDLGKFDWSLRSEIYFRDVNNWILWAINEETGLWGATNLGRVESKGLDITAVVSSFINDTKLKYSGSVEWLSSINKEPIVFPDIEVGQQLFYTPKRRMNHGFSIQARNLKAKITAIWQDESLGINEHISSNTILNIGASRRFNFKKMSTLLSINIENILNKNYFIIERRPLPGRNFTMGIQMNF